MKDWKILHKLADKEFCDGTCDLKPPFGKCPGCRARKTLSTADEMVHLTVRRIRFECQLREGAEPYYDDIYLGE